MDFFEVVHTQRAIRRFKPDPVPQESVWRMIDAAIRAPSGGNTQPWSFLVMSDPEKRRVIADDQKGSANWVASYTFTDTGRKVINPTTAHFTFRDGVIVNHYDFWNPAHLAAQIAPEPGPASA